MSSSENSKKRAYIPVNVRDATVDDIPQILSLVAKFSKPDPTTGEINIWTPPSEELLKRIVEAKECVVAESAATVSRSSSSNDEQQNNNSKARKILGYNLRRTQTVDADVGYVHGFAKTLEVSPFIDKYPPSAPSGGDDGEEEEEMANVYKGSKISFGNQTIVDDVAQGTNVIDELTLGFGKQIVQRFGQTFVLASVLKSNVRSMKMSQRMGATLIGECSSKHDGNNDVALWISPNLTKLIAAMEPEIEARKKEFGAATSSTTA